MKQAHFLSDFICCDGKCTSAHIGSFFYFPWSYCCCWVLSFCWNALWFFTISGGVNFNRQLDSVNLNSLPTKKRFLLKRIQNYKGFPSSFVPFPLMTVCRFDVAWTLLQRDASFSINTEWEPANEGFRFRVCIQNGKCLPTWKTLHILFFNDW